MNILASTDFVKKNQQHIQQLVQQRQHELSLAEAAVLAESRQRQKLRDKVLSMREERWSTSQLEQAEAKSRSYGHSDTMPNCHSSVLQTTSPPRRCLSATSNAKQVTLLPLRCKFLATFLGKIVTVVTGFACDPQILACAYCWKQCWPTAAFNGSHLTKSAGPGQEQAPNNFANTIQKGAGEHGGQAVHAIPQQQDI